MRPFAIAGVQMHLSATYDNVPAMVARIELLMQLYPWVQMVLFSELAPHGPVLQHAQTLPGPTEATFQEVAEKHGIWLIPGSIYERSGNDIYNTASVIDPTGSVVGRYRKLFPFLPYEQGVRGGESFLVFDVPNAGRFGLSICYDLWFPETARTLVAQGAEVILHPSLTPTIDRDVELAIARAAAAQNQCFVIDINGVGDGGNGRSLFVGPAGDVLYQAGTAPEVLPLEIDIQRVTRSRHRGLQGLAQPLKSFRDREVRFDVYHQPSPYLEGLGALVKPTRPDPTGST